VPRGFVYIVLMLMGVVGVLIEGVMVVVLSDCADVVVGRMKRRVVRMLNACDLVFMVLCYPVKSLCQENCGN